MRWLYTAFDLVILAGPLAVTLLWFRGFWRQWRALLLSLSFVSLPWIVLDIAAHASGWWVYNPQYILGVRLLELPAEEIAFFFVVPFACLVVWHGMSQRIRGTVPPDVPRFALGGLIVACILLAALFVTRERTLVDAGILIFTAVALWGTALVRSRAWWYWNGAVLVLFLVFNTVLTAAPVVAYDASFMTGWLVGTIPFEDFLYNFSLLNMSLLVYERSRKAANAK